MSCENSLPYKLSPPAGKQLKKIRKTDRALFDKIKIVIDDICDNPGLGEPKKGDLKGYSCVDITHLRTNYELCYTLEEDTNGQLVLIVMIGPRENFYKDLKRYLKK